jgi:hypothetical protein
MKLPTEEEKLSSKRADPGIRALSIGTVELNKREK